jgi:uncharacterized protein (TIGR00288 family)
MLKHQDQRVGVFVDVGNMYHSAKNLHGSRVNFKAVLTSAVSDRKLIRAIAYCVRSNAPEEEKFFEALDKSGFEIKMKDLQVFYGGLKKGDWDVGLAMDSIKMSPKLDVVCLVSGDGDFIPLVEYLQYHGLLVEIIAFGETCSSKLRETADDFLDLSSDKRKFLITKRE